MIISGVMVFLGVLSIGIGAVLYIGKLYAFFFAIGGVLVFIGIICNDFLDGSDDYITHRADVSPYDLAKAKDEIFNEHSTFTVDSMSKAKDTLDARDE